MWKEKRKEKKYTPPSFLKPMNMEEGVYSWHNPLYVRDLSIHLFWYPGGNILCGLLEAIPKETEGWLYQERAELMERKAFERLCGCYLLNCTWLFVTPCAVGLYPPGCSIHGISQARILEWVPFPAPGDLPNPGIRPASPESQGDFFPLSHWGSQK